LEAPMKEAIQDAPQEWMVAIGSKPAQDTVGSATNKK